MEVETVILGLGIFCCLVSALSLARLQLRKALKGGIYTSVLKPLDVLEKTHAKFAGWLFVIGSILVAIGIAQ